MSQSKAIAPNVRTATEITRCLGECTGVGL